MESTVRPLTGVACACVDTGTAQSKQPIAVRVRRVITLQRIEHGGFTNPNLENPIKYVWITLAILAVREQVRGLNLVSDATLTSMIEFPNESYRQVDDHAESARYG
jgi:hypothetical protein